ncbi:MAG: exo-alpha-sialidase [Thermoleophilia bacterium]
MRPAIAAAVIVLAGVAVFAASIMLSGSSSSKGQPALAFTKGDREANVKDLAGIANEGPAASYAAQQEAERAYPAEAVPFESTGNSISSFKALKGKGSGKGSWQSIGPSQAKYPAVLDQFLAGGKEYTASGRVTAMAIGGCKKESKCSLYVGAAGGGVWVADKATDKQGNVHWQFKSGLFGTNAIGSLLVDPSDPTGNTVYAGTGEGNASGDSEAGLGIYKSTDGGDNWSLVPGSIIFRDRAVSSMALDKDGNLLVGLTSAIRGVSSVTGGAVGCPTPTSPPGCSLRGLYRQTGATFTRIFTSAAGTRGVNEVAVDPNSSTVLYLASFQQGVWRSLDNGTTWTQIKTPLNAAANTDRAQFAVNKLTGGKTRMYVGVGNVGAPAARFFRTDDAAGAAIFADMTTPQNINYCTGQCWYDNFVYSPAEDANVVYLSGSFSYGQQHVLNNGRAVLLSTDGGATWSDMTLDKGNDGWLHPDQHALVTVPGEPLQWIAGNDGGVVRSNGKYVDASSDCDSRGLNAADTAFCKSLLSRIPEQTTVLNKGLVTLQFQSLSVDPKHPQNSLMGGTQDNGTFEYNGSQDVWPQIIYGDGGQSGWNAADSKLRFNSFFGQFHDVNFRNGEETKWVIASGPIAASPEGSNFYAPIIADPDPARAGSIFEGSQSVWRTQDWGGDRDYLEANCPEFTTDGADPACGDFVRLGPLGARDLTAPNAVDPSVVFGTDRAGLRVAAVERAPSNTGTLWAATNTGRVFITDNADAPAASVVWTRLDTSAANDPNRFVSSIYIDPANPNHAWISYSGYSINTPTTPGHVFEVTRVGGIATWVDRTYNLDDLPVTDLVRDDLTGDLYAATDFGVMKLANGATSWTVAAAGIPMVEVPGLTIVPSARVLYAATHGLGAWELDLGKP